MLPGPILVNDIVFLYTNHEELWEAYHDDMYTLLGRYGDVLFYIEVGHSIINIRIHLCPFV